MSEILEELELKYGTKSWVHIDAALYGNVFPFLNEIRGESKKYDFINKKVSSINLSAHKWFGMIVHTSVLIVRKSQVVDPSQKDNEHILKSF